MCVNPKSVPFAKTHLFGKRFSVSAGKCWPQGHRTGALKNRKEALDR